MTGGCSRPYPSPLEIYHPHPCLHVHLTLSSGLSASLPGNGFSMVTEFGTLPGPQWSHLSIFSSISYLKRPFSEVRSQFWVGTPLRGCSCTVDFLSGDILSSSVLLFYIPLINSQPKPMRNQKQTSWSWKLLQPLRPMPKFHLYIQFPVGLYSTYNLHSWPFRAWVPLSKLSSLPL